MTLCKMDARLRVLIVGDVMMDQYLEGQAQRISREAPAPILRDPNQFNRPGGGADVTPNIAALGRKVTLLAFEGRDPASQLFLNIADTAVNAVGRGEVEYIDFSVHLEARHQSFTQANIGALRSAGYNADFSTVADAVACYAKWFNGQ